MKIEYKFEFEDESQNSEISFEYNEEGDERLTVEIEENIPVLYLNRAACLLMAKTFAKLALGKYKDGFHLHMTNDFEYESAENLRIILDNSLKKQ